MMTKEPPSTAALSPVLPLDEESARPGRRQGVRSVAAMLPLLIACFMPCHLVRASHPLEEWQQRGPLPTSRELQDIAAGEGKLVVAFGDPAGRALVSEDGVNFEAVPLNLPPGLAATRVLHANGKWLLLAGGRIWCKGTWTDAWLEGDTIPHGLVELRSLDGAFWGWSAGGFFPSGTPPHSSVWRNSTLYRSSDGLSWSAVPVSPVATDRFAITDLLHAADSFVLTNAAYQSPAGVWTSTDGIAWTGLTQLAASHYSITHGNGLFVAGASGGGISRSTDAVNWTTAQFPFVVHYLTNGQPGSSWPVYSEAREVVFSNGKFVALAEGHFGYPLLAESADGVTWTSVTGGDADFGRAAAKNLRQVGNDTYLLGQNGNLWRTTLWQTGHVRLLPLDAWDWRAVAASATRVVVAGEGGHLAWSDDATAFHSLLLPDAAGVEDLTWVPELALFLAAGGDESTGRVWSSANGADWTSHTLAGFGGRATGVAWDGAQLLVCGPGGRLAASTDGIQWTARESGTTESLTAIEWGSGHFVATGSGGIVIHSADGIAWTTHALGPDTVTYRGLVHGNGLWIVPDGYELHLTTDLVNWWTAPGQAYEPNPLFAFGEFITTNQRYILGSSDGGHWQTYVDGLSAATSYTPAGGYVRGTRFGDRVVFVGKNGLIGTSGAWRDFFQEWQAEKFTAAELGQAETSGPDADPDGDGWSNLFEYAFDLNPKAREAAGKSNASTYHAENENYFTGTVARYSHPWAARRPGVAVWPERSHDLLNWTRDGMLSDYPYSIGAGKMRRDIRLPIRSAAPEFIRLRAEIAAP